MADFACRECGDEARDGSNYCCESCAVEGAYKAGRAEEREAAAAYCWPNTALSQGIRDGKHLSNEGEPRAAKRARRAALALCSTLGIETPGESE